MYNWLFFKIYNFLKQKNNHDSLFNASLLLFFSQGVHFFLVLKLLSYLLDFKILKFSDDNTLNKLTFLPIALIWGYFVYIYYTKKVKKSKQVKIQSLKTSQFLLLLIIIIIFPLLVLIKIS